MSSVGVEKDGGRSHGGRETNVTAYIGNVSFGHSCHLTLAPNARLRECGGALI